MITVNPRGGLGNRIRVLASILELNRSLKTDIHIIWECGPELNCPFEELFYTPPRCNVKSDFRSKFDLFLERTGGKKWREKFYDLVLYDNEIVRIRESSDEAAELLKGHSVYIKTCQNITSYSRVSELIGFKDSVYEIARPVYNQFDLANTYGLHIRRTDNAESKKHSPTELFIQLVKEKLKDEENARFYLATDSTQVKEQFKIKFQDRIITFPGINLDRNSKEGVKHALAEMICLSETKKIYGSHFSTYTIVAALMNRVRYEVISR